MILRITCLIENKHGKIEASFMTILRGSLFSIVNFAINVWKHFNIISNILFEYWCLFQSRHSAIHMFLDFKYNVPSSRFYIYIYHALNTPLSRNRNTEKSWNLKRACVHKYVSWITITGGDRTQMCLLNFESLTWQH